MVNDRLCAREDRNKDRSGWVALQRELAGDEEQCRNKRQAQGRLGRPHRHIAAENDARQRAGQQRAKQMPVDRASAQ
jgi:hypothetical protein